MVGVLSRRLPSGFDLHLTLDLDFQQKIMELIKDQRASVAVIDLETEGLLAMASSPAMIRIFLSVHPRARGGFPFLRMFKAR